MTLPNFFYAEPRFRVIEPGYRKTEGGKRMDTRYSRHKLCVGSRLLSRRSLRDQKGSRRGVRADGARGRAIPPSKPERYRSR